MRFEQEQMRNKGILSKISKEIKLLEIEQKKNVSYTGIVLYEREHNLLLNVCSQLIPQGWEKIAHHLTVNLGPWKGDRDLLGKNYQIIVDGFAKNDLVVAAKAWVDESLFSVKIPHITIAVNREAGGKPALSNALNFSDENLEKKRVVLFGKLVEVAHGDSRFADNY